MKKITKIALVGIILGLALVTFITNRVGLSKIIDLFRKASPIFIVGYIAISILIAVVLTFKWKLILHAKGIDVPFHRLFGYRLVGYSVGYLTPSARAGGEPVRAYLLKREGVKVTTAMSTVIIDKAIEVFADLCFFFFGAVLILNSVTVDETVKVVLLVFSLFLILAMGMFIGAIVGKRRVFVRVFRFLRLHKIKRLQKMEKSMAQVEDEIEQFYRTKKEYFIYIILFIVLIWGMMFLEYRFAMLILGFKATAVQIFLILTGVGLAYTLPLPAAVGALEVGELSVAQVLGLTSATAVAIAFLIRARDLIWTAIGLVYLSIYQFSFKNLSEKTAEIDKEFEEGKILHPRE